MKKKIRFMYGLEQATLDEINYVIQQMKGGDMYEEDKETVRNIFRHIEGSPVRPGKHYFEDYRMLHRKLYDAKARILLIIDKLSIYHSDRDKLFEIVTNMSKSKQ